MKIINNQTVFQTYELDNLRFHFLKFSPNELKTTLYEGGEFIGALSDLVVSPVSDNQEYNGPNTDFKFASIFNTIKDFRRFGLENKPSDRDFDGYWIVPISKNQSYEQIIETINLLNGMNRKPKVVVSR